MLVKVAEDGLVLVAENENERKMLSKLWNDTLMVAYSCKENEIKLKSCKLTECFHLTMDGLNTNELINIIESCLKEISKRVQEIEEIFKKIKI